VTYATLFMPDGRLALALLTRREGGPFVCEYEPPRFGGQQYMPPTLAEKARRNANAEHILWSHVHDHAPSVFDEARSRGWVTAHQGNGQKESNE
jgi:hypothetical protein